MALNLVPAFVLLPFLVASSVGRRFGSTPKHVVVREDGTLDIGGNVVAKDDIRDVWLDEDPLEPRVVLAIHGGEAASPPKEDFAPLALWFENREQAKRFARALPAPHEIVAGYRPAKMDLFSPFRFVAVTLVLVAGHAYYGAFVLLFFALEVRSFYLARQLVVRGDTFELRSTFDAESFALSSVVKVDLDEGIITLNGEREIVFATPNARDLHLATPLWSDRLRRRALEAIDKNRKAGDAKATDLSGTED